MGFESEVLKVWNSLVPGSTEYLQKGPTFLPEKKRGRSRAYVVDLPSHLQTRTTTAFEGQALTFGDWLTQERWRIQEIFNDPSFKIAILLLDCGTPQNKTVSRYAKSGKTPLTPKEGWRAHLAEKARTFDDRKMGPLDDTSVVADIDLPLPGEKTPGEEQLFTYNDYLTNKDFKILFYEIICANLLQELILDGGRIVVLRGPNVALRFCDRVVSAPDENCKFRYKEADSVVGYFAAILSGYDICFESVDGDVILALLMGSNSRLNRGAIMRTVDDLDTCFKNRVYVIRGQYSPFANSVVDINRLYYNILLQSRAFAVTYRVVDPRTKQLTEKYVARNPILDQVLLAVLSGRNDYVLSSLLPQIAVKKLFVTYLRCFPAFPDGLTYKHITEAGYVGCYVDGTPFWRFVVSCYKTSYPTLKIDLNNLPYSLDRIREMLPEGSRAEAPTVDRIRMMVGQLSWYMTYFTNASYRVEEHPDPMERRRGRSMWGWKMERIAKDNYGFSKADWDENVDVEWIDELFEPGKQQTLKDKKPKMQPPRADPSKLISDQMMF